MSNFEVGDVIEVTNPEYPDYLVRGKVSGIEADGDFTLEGFSDFIVLNDEDEVQVVKKARRIGDSYTNPYTGERLVYVGKREIGFPWVYANHFNPFKEVSDTLAEELLRDQNWKKDN